MADQKLVAILRQGAVEWDAWRRGSNRKIDLSAANLSGANLNRADLSGARLRVVDLSNAVLLSANLSGANLTQANLSGADFHDVRLHETVLANVDLSDVTGLETCRHRGPTLSTIERCNGPAVCLSRFCVG